MLRSQARLRFAHSLKTSPPATPATFVARRGLEGRLAGATTRRLTTVVAGPGFGKSTLLAAWAESAGHAWYAVDRHDGDTAVLASGLIDALRVRLPSLAPALATAAQAAGGPTGGGADRTEALAGLVSEAVEEHLADDLVLVLDDVQEIGRRSPSVRLIEALVRQAPAGLHLVLSSRAELPFPVQRLRGRGQLLELGPSTLAFSVDEVRQLLVASIREAQPEMAEELHEMTGGWPAAVILLLERLREDGSGGVPGLSSLLRQRNEPLFAYLAEEVLGREPANVRELLRAVAAFDGFTADLCDAIGVKRARDTIASLARRGLFIQARGPDGWFTVNGLAREFARERWPLDEAKRRQLHRRAAAWFESKGYIQEALRSLASTPGDPDMARLLASHGSKLLASGATDTMIRAAEALPSELRDAAIEQMLGQAYQIRGDWELALAAFRRAAGPVAKLPSGLAWRWGLIHYLRSELEEAFDVYRRGRLDGSKLADDALLLAWWAAAHWLRGEVEPCRRLATEAFEAATASQDLHALAAAHTTLAMLAAMEGDPRANAEHYLHALTAAEHAGDVLQIIRIRTNRASRRTEEGAYHDALGDLEVAIPLAQAAGFAANVALGLSNRANALMPLGRLEEAVADYEVAKSTYQRLGSGSICYPLGGLGDAFRERGDLALSRAAYEEAVALAEGARNVQGLAPALAGLARVMVADDPSEATRLATRALGCGTGVAYVRALLASGWVALATGNRVGAAETGQEAAAVARERRDRAGLAEAVELQVFSSPKPRDQLGRLEDALGIWQEIGHRLGEARARFALARLLGTERSRGLVERTRTDLRSLGVRDLAAAAAGLLHAVGGEEQAAVKIQTLGGFNVFRAGAPIPQPEWRSQKARTLLKMLVARRGHPIPREAAMELLWPDEDPERISNRLSVALTTIRSVLDPARRFDQDHFIVADKGALRLNLANLSIDVEDFRHEARSGLALDRDGRVEEATPVLISAEEAYTGDFLEDDPYEDWAVPVREESRDLYICLARALGQAALAAGDQEVSVRYRLRILERDAYDEEAHQGLVSALVHAGRHGEARRCYGTYVARMQELGVEPAPFPAPS